MPATRSQKIFLARHGESVANREKLISGQIDTPLSDKGRQQAQWLSEVVQKEALTAIYTSTLRRSIETAKPVAARHGLSIRQLAALKEKHFGALQGIPHQQNSYDEAFEIAQLPSAGLAEPGEEETAFCARIKFGLDLILAELCGTALIVGHRKTNEVILASLLGESSTTHGLNIKNKYVYEIILEDKAVINTIRLGGEFHGKKFSGIKDD